MEKESLRPILESLIFASESALTINNMVSVLDGVEKAEVRTALKELVEEYKARSGGIFIEEVAGGYQLRTAPENAPWIKRLFKTSGKRMSRAAMETLSIVAYRQPVTRGELEAIRGVDSGGVLSTLLERRLIKILGRKETPGRPVVYGTTKTFLETFDLKDLSCLPTLKEIQALEAEDDAQETPEDTFAEDGGGAGGEGPPEAEGGEETLDKEPDMPDMDEKPEPKEFASPPISPEDPLSNEAPEGDSRGGGDLSAQGRRDDSRGAGYGEPQGGLGDGGEG
jgi:segregation and condensation protein B